PQLIAGPIERAGNLLLQLRRAVTLGPSARNWAAGLQLILLGLFKKAVLADHLAPYADAAFADPSAVSGWTVIVGTYAFALQIYFDFSAYSEIAKGSARLFGVDLVWNFDQPYLAGDIAAFWRRWHMSLSSWFRDYVFIPLGGSRGGRARALRNLVITMFLSGLWHGAAWSFVLWGLYHGALLLGHALWRRAALAQRLAARAPGWYRLLGWLLTFELVTLGWILFRAAEDRHIPALLRLVASPGAPDASQLVAVIGVHALCGLWYLERRLRLRTVVHRSAALSLLVYGALAVITALFARDDGPQFIYFQF
ncbi:MAG: MBOAT family protein, partial [Myxococcales bacterium]|nr:MBOAT family protein [Myxococcales bacterium]